MRRGVDIALWIVLLSLPALVAVGASGDLGGWERLEREFVEGLGRVDGLARSTAFSSAVGEVWFVFFRDFQQLLGLPGFFGHPSSVLAGWLLIAIATTVGVGGGLGTLPAALALVLLALHPLTGTLGAAMTPWLPAAAFTLLGIAFLQAMALPTIQRRWASPGRWIPRIFAIVGCGMAWGLASSAEARVGWLMLIPGFLLILSVIAVSLTLWRLKDRLTPTSLLVNPWAILRRTLPWAACWFFVLVLFVWIYDLLTPALSEHLPHVPPIDTLERVLAWAVLPGTLILGLREGEILGYRSQLGGRTVLFVGLASFFLVGPAMRPDCGPLERLLQAPALGASIAAWMRWRG